jgi:oxalate decarboxylase
MASSSPHVRSLREAPVQHESDGGSIRRLTKDAFPMLERISIKRLVIEPGCLREPHWHANADELTYCLSGDLSGAERRPALSASASARSG